MPSSTRSLPTTAMTACRTCGLRDWLEELRLEAGPLYPDGVVPRPEPIDGAPPDDLAADQAETRAREEALRAGRARGSCRTHRRTAGSLAARRPARLAPARGQAPVVGPLPAHGSVDGRARRRRGCTRRPDASRGGRTSGPLRHPSLPVRPGPGDQARPRRRGHRPGNRGDRAGASSPSTRWPGPSTSSGTRRMPHPRALIPSKPYGPEPMRGALGRLADWTIAHGIEGPGPYRAARDLVLRNMPRITDMAAGAAPGRRRMKTPDGQRGAWPFASTRRRCPSRVPQGPARPGPEPG